MKPELKTDIMRTFKRLFLLVILYPACSSANIDIDIAMQAYKEKKYDHAAQVIIKNIKNLDSLSVVDKLKSALIFSKNLKLYQDIYTKSKIHQKKYLSTLVNDDNENKSLFAKLYLSEILILNHDFNEAESLLKEFKNSIPEKNNYHQIATIYSAWIAYLKGHKQKYNTLIKTTDRSQPIVDMTIQYIEILLTGKTKNTLNKIKQYEKKFLNNKNLSSRFSNYAIRLYLNQNDLKSAANVLKQLDQRQPSYIENLDKNKILRFYDVTLVDTVAEFYYAFSKLLLTAVSQDKKYHDLAIFHLSEIDLIRFRIDSAKKSLKGVNKLKRLPKSMSKLTEIRSTTHQYLIGQHTRAYRAWQATVDNFKNDPAQSADVVLMCIYLDANCPKIVKTAQVSAENGQSKRFEVLNTNVGRYFLLKRNNAKALRLLENAMDKSNTNSLFANEPMLLLNYAEALRLNKNFSESLQILFSLGENFPIMRQVQNAVQGEYLFRQRSSGFNNVF